MESEGPYKLKILPVSGERKGKLGPSCIEFNGIPKISREGLTCHDALEAIAFHLNNSYAEGRKSAEKDFAQKLVSIAQMRRVLEDKEEKDFKELLELAEALHGDIDFISTSTQDFSAWKKARGIE